MAMNDSEGTVQPNQANDAEPDFFVVSPLKFVLMSVCTLSIYEFYWSYKNWKAIRQRDNSEIMPFWRSFFYPIWHYWLLKELNETFQSRALSSVGFRAVLGVGVVLLRFAWQLPAPFWLLPFLTFACFLPAIQAMQSSGSGGLVQKPARSFHPANLLAYVLGGPLFIYLTLMAIGFFPTSAVVKGGALWDRDVSYLREAAILGPEENIAYFYSGALWSIRDDGQFFSEDRVISYFRHPNTGDMYLADTSFSEISYIDVEWSKSFLEPTVVTITTQDNRRLELWLPPEAGGDRKFFDALMVQWHSVKHSKQQ